MTIIFFPIFGLPSSPKPLVVIKHFYLAFTALALTLTATSQSERKTVVTEPATNPLVQQEIRQSADWQSFTAQHGPWWVDFNQVTQLPHRAVGEAIAPSASDKATAARQFINAYPGAENVTLEQESVLEGRALTYVHFTQEYQGLKVWFSHAQVRFNNEGNIVMFGMDLFPDVQVSTTPTISNTSIPGFAQAGLSGTVLSSTVSPELGVLPVLEGTKYAYRLVYEVIVETVEADGQPGRFFTLADAHNGAVLYRQNRVHSCGEYIMSALPPATVEADINATITDNPGQATAVRGLPHLKVTINGTDYYTDANGHLNESLTAPVTATVTLAGLYSEVFQGSATQPASFTTTLNAGPNTISFNANADPTERSAYYHVNVVHDFMRTLIPAPGFTNMDFPLQTNVDQPGSCNANYTGTAINFLSAGGACPAAALFSDVIYHEYGHGINYEFYDFLGGNFNNGAQGEGYSDVWGFMITENPVLAAGFQGPGTVIRRYDLAPAVYPQDLVGEVHADGEIIAGAWWDTYLNLGNDMTTMSALFIESHNGLATAPDGQEGRLYRDILLDVLLADDSDGNVLNGTPNDSAIIAAFARHGITLLTNATFFHNPLDLEPADLPIDIDASMLVETDFMPFVGDMKLFYRTHKDSAWTETAMTHVSGIDYTGEIPAQPKATIVDYYITVNDVFGNNAVVSPFLANDTNPNLPYQVLVGYEVDHLEDFDIEFGNWNVDPFGTDQAATGVWVVDIPVASYLDPSNPGSICQTGTDHTPNNNGNLCSVTGNATPGDGIGTNDVDSGRTTLISPVYDLTAYEDPAFAYWRWYSNAQGANPANDVWQVFISDDQTNWVRVERTNVADRSWRRNAIRVRDYVDKTSTVSFIFVAQDSVIPSNPTFSGGSVVEAAVDDLFLYDKVEDAPGGLEAAALSVSVFPNPASESVTIMCSDCATGTTVEVNNALGQVIEVSTLQSSALVLDLSSWAAGVYTVRLQSGENSSATKVVVR